MIKNELNLKSDKVKNLILAEDNGDLPQYPSAQFWNRMTQKEKDEMIAFVGEGWAEYEVKMKSHWPKEKTSMTKYKDKEGRH